MSECASGINHVSLRTASLHDPHKVSLIPIWIRRHLGVRYTYQKDTPEAFTRTLEPEDLASLPVELRKELEDAMISLDIARIASAVGHISAHNAALGHTLSQYTEKYAYSSILRALQHPVRNACFR